MCFIECVYVCVCVYILVYDHFQIRPKQLCIREYLKRLKKKTCSIILCSSHIWKARHNNFNRFHFTIHWVQRRLKFRISIKLKNNFSEYNLLNFETNVINATSGTYKTIFLHYFEMVSRHLCYKNYISIGKLCIAL